MLIQRYPLKYKTTSSRFRLFNGASGMETVRSRSVIICHRHHRHFRQSFYFDTSLLHHVTCCTTTKLYCNFSVVMPYINVGETLPSVDLYEETPENVKNMLDLVRRKKAIIFGVTGAFVPGCSRIHLRGFIEKSDELRSKGFDEIICISVNDPFVLSAWGWAMGASGKVRILADPTASYTKAIKMGIERLDLGGVRSRRYSMITEEAIVKELYVEGSNIDHTCLQRRPPLPT